MVDAPYAPIEPAAGEIPPAPAPMHPAPPPVTDGAAPDSIVERTLFDRLAGGFRIEPIMGRLRPAAPPPSAQPEEVELDAFAPPRRRCRTEAARSRPSPAAEEGDENPFTPDTLLADPPAARRPAAGVKIVPRKTRHGAGQARRQGRPARARSRRRLPAAAARSPVAAVAGQRPRPRSTRPRWSRTPACSRRCSRTSASRARS